MCCSPSYKECPNNTKRASIPRESSHHHLYLQQKPSPHPPAPFPSRPASAAITAAPSPLPTAPHGACAAPSGRAAAGGGAPLRDAATRRGRPRRHFESVAGGRRRRSGEAPRPPGISRPGGSEAPEMAANRNLKQVRIENSSPAAPLGMVGGGGGGGGLKGLRGLEAESEAAAAAAMALVPGKEAGDEEQEGGFTIDIKSFLKPGEKSYTQRCRLFVGNLPTDITEEDFKRLFERYGEPSEVFINRDRGFGFIRLVRLRVSPRGSLRDPASAAGSPQSPAPRPPLAARRRQQLPPSLFFPLLLLLLPLIPPPVPFLPPSIQARGLHCERPPLPLALGFPGHHWEPPLFLGLVSGFYHQFA